MEKPLQPLLLEQYSSWNVTMENCLACLQLKQQRHLIIKSQRLLHLVPK